MKQESGRNALLPTNEDTSGPYFPIYFRDESLEDLTNVHAGVVAGALGDHIILKGRVFDRHGNLANGAMLEIWQANAEGVYRSPASANDPDIDPWFTGYGRQRSATGDYSFRTIKPGGVGNRAPNITITIFSDGINRIVTQMFFDGDAANKTDPLLAALDADDQGRLMARHDGRTADGAEVYRFDIVMAGDNETPFFDDFES